MQYEAHFLHRGSVTIGTMFSSLEEIECITLAMVMGYSSLVRESVNDIEMSSRENRDHLDHIGRTRRLFLVMAKGDVREIG